MFMKDPKIVNFKQNEKMYHKNNNKMTQTHSEMVH